MFTDLHEIAETFERLQVPTYVGLRQVWGPTQKADAQREYRKANPEKIRKAEQEYLSRPEVQERRAAYLREYRQRPDVQAKQRDRVRAKRRARQKVAWQRAARQAARATMTTA